MMTVELPRLSVDAEHQLIYRPTPWDGRVFGFGTVEIVGFQYETIAGLRALLETLEQHCEREDIGLVYSRIPATDLPLRAALTDARFYFAETTLDVERAFPISEAVLLESGGRRLQLSRAAPDDIDDIKAIARDHFHFGRFHEDPRVSPRMARERYVGFIDDLVRDGAELLVYRRAGEAIAFHAQRWREDDRCELILTGTRSDASMIAYPFWGAIFESLNRREVRSVFTRISAANVPICNLYWRFGFQHRATWFGFHRCRV